jgi:putative aldouronate transport system substrate-binding protein
MKKTMIILLIGLLICSVLSAGGNAEEGSDSEVNTFESVTFPLDQPVELTFLFQTRLIDDLNDLTIIKEIQEQTNVHINWDIIQSGWNEQKSLMFASNDLPDAFFGTKSLNSVDIMGNSAFFTPLEEYIEAYAPNIQKMFETDPKMEGYVTAPDGHIYSIPQRMPNRPSSRGMMYMNKNWLDNVGLEVPATTDDFYTVLKAFKDQDPNGNGKADELPMIFYALNRTNSIKCLLGAFGLSDNTSGDNIMLENGELSYIFANERIKDFVSYFNMLYEEDLFSSENFTMKWGEIVAQNRTPDIAVVGSGFHWTVGAAMNNSEREKEYVAVPPLKGPTGFQLWRPASIMTINNVAFAMTEKNPEKAVTMAYLDLFYNPEVGVQLYHGAVGEALTLDDSGIYTILPSQDPTMTQSAWSWSLGMNDLSPVYLSSEFEKRIKLGYSDEKSEVDKLYKSYIEQVDEFPPFLWFSIDEGSELNLLKSEIDSFAVQKVSQWIMEGNINEEWDAYIKQLKSIGLDRMLEMYKTAYERSSM